ncbi:hypothetical protein NHQ30_011089 [Ciborinia camelliae]|nr:hypothetical protein NHQ30_011089 [Ciborinia camelliae]
MPCRRQRTKLPSPLSSSFSDEEVDIDLKLRGHQVLSPELLKSLKQACLQIEKRMIVEEEDRMWKAVTEKTPVYKAKRWRGTSPVD